MILLIRIIFCLLDHIPRCHFNTEIDTSIFQDFIRIRATFTGDSCRDLEKLVACNITGITNQLQRDMEVSCSFTLIPIIIVAGNNQTGLVSATLLFRIRPITISSEWNTHNAFRAICIDIFVKIPSCQSVSSRSQ